MGRVSGEPARSHYSRWYLREEREGERRRAKRKAPGSGLFSTPSRPGSIVGAEAFHFRVRDGNGWFHLALATRSQFSVVSCELPVVSWGGLASAPCFALVAGVGLESTTSGL